MTKPDGIVMTALDSLQRCAEAVEYRIAAILDAAAPENDGRLLKAMRYCALNGGKRIRPFLVVETARLFAQVDGEVSEAAWDAALAVELIHCYSLVHDDLPAMDDDDVRRGQPTCHKVFDEATAILAGDALQSLAFQVLAGSGHFADPSQQLAVLASLSTASGLSGMAGGQMLDLEAEARSGHATSDITRIQEKKTGALFRFSIQAGATIGSASPTEREALLRFADALGLAFQVADDLLDNDGDAATVGKATGKDAAAGKATFISLLGVDGARQKLHDLESDALRALSIFGERAAVLGDTMRFVSTRVS